MIIFSAYEHYSSFMFFYLHPFLWNIYGNYNASFYSQYMSGKRSFFNPGFPVLPSHLVKVLAFNLANFYTKKSIS